LKATPFRDHRRSSLYIIFSPSLLEGEDLNEKCFALKAKQSEWFESHPLSGSPQVIPFPAQVSENTLFDLIAICIEIPSNYFISKI
jgi:hypothetical protein